MSIVYDKIYKQHGFSQTQQQIIKRVGRDKVLLEIGSSTGYMTMAFLNNNCIVDVVENSQEALAKVSKRVRKIFNFSIEGENVINILAKDYDFIIMADVLEHLVNPAKTLKILRKIATAKTALIISLPNVANWIMRKQLFFKGDFEYQESGILDKTHLHFYTVNTLAKFLSENGWAVRELVGTITRLPFEESISKIPLVGFLFRSFFYKNLVEKYKNLSYYHFLVVAFKK